MDITYNIDTMNANFGELYVIKRNGTKEPIHFDKITKRIAKLCTASDLKYVIPSRIALETIKQFGDNSLMTTQEIDKLSSKVCAEHTVEHPRYSLIAGRILVSNLHKNIQKTKNVQKTFSEIIDYLHHSKTINDEENNTFAQDFYEFIMKNAKELNQMIVNDRDYKFDYFAFSTLDSAYLMKKKTYTIDQNGQKIEHVNTVETPQYLYLRVAVQIHYKNGTLDDIKHCYDDMSQGYYTHATPTLFNAGLLKNSMISCFLDNVGDSIKEIYQCLARCADMSQAAGGIGISISNVRATGSHIKGTNGFSNGIVPMLKVFNETARYVDQCNHPSTYVITWNGIKKVSDVKIVDQILTHDGSFQTIKKVINNVAVNTKMIVLNTKWNDKKRLSYITGNHPIYCLHNNKFELNEILKRLDNDMIKPEYVSSSEILVGDLIGIPIPTVSSEIYNLTKDDYMMYGYLLSVCMFAKDFSCISVLIKYDTIVEKIKTYLENNLIAYEINDHYLKWNFDYKFKFNKAMLFNDNNRVIGSEFLNINNKNIHIILDTFYEVYGYNEWLLYNEEICYGICHWFLRLGILVEFEECHLNRMYPYKMSVPSNFQSLYSLDNYVNNDKQYIKYRNYVYSQVIAKDIIDYNGPIYDFQINNNENYVTQLGLLHNGGGKRKGSIAVYIEPWHADIYSFLELRKKQGDERTTARDLFLALWIPDLFMKRVAENGLWSLFCPNECPGLHTSYGDKFEQLYVKYETEKRYRTQINAKDLLVQIISCQIENGVPYVSFKDTVNRYSNQKNIGTILSSNLCNEINEVVLPGETACCNLASIALPKFVKDNKFDFEKLREIAYKVCVNLNNVIDVNYYPTVESRKSNLRHRPIGMGIQGLADVYVLMRMPFESKEANQLNSEIFETIYLGALEASCDLAMRDGHYETFPGSPFSKGILQFDNYIQDGHIVNLMWDWNPLKERIKIYGTRNSLITALMPTASTAQILGNNECFEPFTSLIYTRKVLAGKYTLVNKHLINDLMKLELWNRQMYEKITHYNGSIQEIEEIPKTIRELYKNVYEIKQKNMIIQAATRAPFIDQTQSMNLFFDKTLISKYVLSKCAPEDRNDSALIEKRTNDELGKRVYHALNFGWSLHLKSGIYYLRTTTSIDAHKFTLSQSSIKKTIKLPKIKANEIEETTGEVCESCSA